ncbi:MAG TPA: N-acetylmuramoyl-L-alanine amidase [Candidatus Kapabacteria bacterium]|nr:N-acetylmuramoyl-L-alanine amidase [Candidatus Kapabacteria bacterium]
MPSCLQATYRCLLMLALLAPAPAALRAQPAPALRDISVATKGTTGTITLLFSSTVRTVVLASRGNGLAQVRMKPVQAARAALNSALPRPGVRSVAAHIERGNVLVANTTFTREVLTLTIVARDSRRVVVQARLGKPLAADRAGRSGQPRSGISGSSTRAVTGKVPDRALPASSAPGDTDAAATGPMRRAWSLSTIVIDAGHGGKDPGALGIENLQEKDVTLAVALALRDQVRARMPGVKVVMTRDDDRFIELYRRGQIANEHGGKLFISIHCNSMPEKPHPASGFECYILRPGKSDDAASVAALENSVIRFEADQGKYPSRSAENTILASMAQSAFVRYSDKLAREIRHAMRGHTGIPDRGVHQAGFYVLVGASMPGVLVEIGYLSNRKDWKVLNSRSGREKIARSIAEGIRNYERLYSASLAR